MIPPNGVDRFVVGIDIRTWSMMVYALQLFLYCGDQRRPLELGKVLLSEPSLRLRMANEAAAERRLMAQAEYLEQDDRKSRPLLLSLVRQQMSSYVSARLKLIDAVKPAYAHGPFLEVPGQEDCLSM